MTLIQTAKLNGVDPLAWLTDVLERIGLRPNQGARDAHPVAVDVGGCQPGLQSRTAGRVTGSARQPRRCRTAYHLSVRVGCC